MSNVTQGLPAIPDLIDTPGAEINYSRIWHLKNRDVMPDEVDEDPPVDATSELAALYNAAAAELLKDVATYALHGIDLAAFKAAETEPARRGGLVVELCGLKAKLVNWVASNR